MTTEITASPARSVALPSAKGGAGFGSALQQLKGVAGQPAVAKSLPALAMLAMVGIAVLLWMTFTAPPGRQLFQGLPDNDKAAVVEALKSAGIEYSLDSGT